MPRAARTARTTETRNQSARKADVRHMPSNVHTSMLYVPPHKIPAGMTYAWVRIATLNEADHMNWAAKARGGWKPVPRDRHLDIFPSMPIPGMDDKFSAVITLGNGLILCEKPTKDVKAEQLEKRRNHADIIKSIRWTGQDQGTFDEKTPKEDYGSEVGIERVVATPVPAEFKE